jgi:hypothetical protein
LHRGELGLCCKACHEQQGEEDNFICFHCFSVIWLQKYIFFLTNNSFYYLCDRL